ncbi:hypothetical protein RV134_340140 [Roseovarius sp. EC-HK134]|nr:hypothetical protein RV134_340140 [Roseovarius sp. EC-HK134]VVT26537.1 hypothetical protein RV420_400140 [Roseovarius sp. EC-SD190]
MKLGKYVALACVPMYREALFKGGAGHEPSIRISGAGRAGDRHGRGFGRQLSGGARGVR